MICINHNHLNQIILINKNSKNKKIIKNLLKKTMNKLKKQKLFGITFLKMPQKFRKLNAKSIKGYFLEG